MGGEIDHLTNLNIRGLNREVPQIVFYTLANHKGWGVALQDFPISATPSRALEGVVYTPRNYDGRYRGPLRARLALAGAVAGFLPLLYLGFTPRFWLA